MKSHGITTNSKSDDRRRERSAKGRLTTFDEMNSQVAQLSATNRDLEATLRELVEACEAGGTVRYMQASGSARLLLEQLDKGNDSPAAEGD